MTAKVSEVRKTKTNDFGLVLAANDAYTVMAPGVTDNVIVGRYVEKNGVKFALDYAVSVDNVVLGEILGHVPLYHTPKVGRDAPKAFKGLRARWEMIRYIISEDDVRRVQNA